MFDFKRKDLLWIAILSIIVIIPNIYLAININGLSLLQRVALLLVSCLFFILPSLFLKTKVFFALQGIFVLLEPFEIAHIYLNRMPATSAFLLSIVDTNPDESTELMGSIIVPIICWIILCIFYFFVVIKKIDNTSFTPVKIRIYGFLLYAFLIFTGYSVGYNKNIYPLNLILRTYQVFVTKKEAKKGEKTLHDFKFGAKKMDQPTEREIYVFVIGETGRYSSYSLNGYKRNTSPLLGKTDNLVSYTNFFSEANITTSSLSLILTRASATDYKRSYVEKSFVDAFKEAGFKTCWIANQSANNRFIRRISKDADYEYFAATSFDEDNIFDEQLWTFMDEILAKEDRKIMIVLHTLGSHFRYNSRYPSEYEVFKPTFRDRFDYALISSKYRKLFVNTYDNSILYTDFFLAKTIEKIDKLGSISALAYVADHGENLFDTDENIVFHGGSKYTEYDFHVPFFIWTSEKYNLQYPSKSENIYQNKDKKLNTSNIFYSILDIANIDFHEQIPEKSIASESLREDSVRYMINTNMEVEVLNFDD